MRKKFFYLNKTICSLLISLPTSHLICFLVFLSAQLVFQFICTVSNCWSFCPRGQGVILLYCYPSPEAMQLCISKRTSFLSSFSLTHPSFLFLLSNQTVRESHLQLQIVSPPQEPLPIYCPEHSTFLFIARASLSPIHFHFHVQFSDVILFLLPILHIYWPTVSQSVSHSFLFSLLCASILCSVFQPSSIFNEPLHFFPNLLAIYWARSS